MGPSALEMLHSTSTVLLGAFALTIIGAAVSAPAEPSTSPVSLLQAKAAEDAKMTITEMLKSGKDSSACADLADALLAGVESSIKSKEDMLDALPDGSECTSEGQELVDSAKAALTTAESDAEAAHSAAASAASAPVEFGAISLSALGGLSEGHCGTFETNPAYVAAKTAAADAAASSTAADAAVTAARDAVTSAEEEQKKLIHECKCNAVHHYEAAFAAASVVDDSDTAAWTKAKHMQCVLAGTAPADCEVGAIREIPRRTLAEDPAECRDAAEYVMYGDVVHIKNMYTVHQSYLDTCGGAVACASGTKYAVSTNDNKNRDAGTGLWQIESTSGATGKVKVGDEFHLKNMYSAGTYLDTCNHASCTTGTMYRVSTNDNKNRDGHKTGMWQIEMFSGREGYVHYGEELHLKNMYGAGSYLDTCNHAATCAGTRYQVSTNTNKNRGDHKTGTWVLERSE